MVVVSLTPETIQNIERATSPALKKDNVPFGTIYYEYPHDPGTPKKETLIGSIDSRGNKNTLRIPIQCSKTMISWDQRSAFCFGFNGKWWLIDITSNTHVSVNLTGGYPANQFSWSKDGRYLILSSGSDDDISDLNLFDLKNMQIEKLNNVPLNGFVSEAVFSPNNQIIAFVVNTHAANYYSYKQEI